MSDIIHVLPDHVANQIAAGEVIQRPASVIKELVENSIDAGADSIQVVIKDAGRTLIQVIDNGKGMSESDARIAFERHATSKIKSADDLFALHTMGFRGEALASIAAIAQVELRTRREEDEVGTLVEIAGSKIENQTTVSCPVGTNFAIKNIFFNVPARRKFLKSNTAEFAKIESEFNRIALVYPQIEFELIHNGQICMSLKKGTYKERINSVFKNIKGFGSQLFSINVDSSLAKIYGFAGKPETAKKKNDRQYFFVNGRFMKHSYFHSAVIQAYGTMLQPGTSPDYFIYFEIDPESIDVNIHPTKTEIKFENEQSIWPLVMSGVREGLGKFNIAPSIDFDREGADDIPVFSPRGNHSIHAPQVEIDPTYNPFEQENDHSASHSGSTPSYQPRKKSSIGWENLYEGFESSSWRPSESEDFTNGDNDFFVGQGDVEIEPSFVTEEEPEAIQGTMEMKSHTEEAHQEYLQLKNKYILTPVKSGLMCIDQHRAHTRILYDQYISRISQKQSATQQLLFPEIIELSEAESMLLEDAMEDLQYIGFDLAALGKNTYSINGTPANLEGGSPKEYITNIITTLKESRLDFKSQVTQQVALSMAKLAATPYGRTLDSKEMMYLVSNLFMSAEPNFTPDNKLIIKIFSTDDIEKGFK
ncbi:MAG: DNA mismatch repair endonuclease MutL [Paludibacteraceae bacterium]|nr:DNA mismatch repair endonuclease MutL [Paludibacteraceae bacterium]